MSLVSGLKALAKKSAKEAAQKPFYSAVDKAIVDIVGKQPKGTGDQYLGMILKAKGVKPAEVKDRGLDTALKGRGRMSGEDLVKTAEERPAPQLEEKQFGMTMTKESEADLENEMKKALERKVTNEYENNASEYEIESLRNYYNSNAGREELKKEVIADDPDRYVYDASYSGYKTEGGENYREIVISLPGKEIYKAQHFSNVKNPLAHARVQDMTGPNGEKILLIDEIQSDWHQTGRKKGYRSEEAQNKYAEAQKELAEYEASLKPRVKKLLEDAKLPQESIDPILESSEYELANILKEREKLQELYQNSINLEPWKLPPDAPFKKNWQELVVKRLMDDAAKKGYDKVLIAPGDAQLERYPLSKHIDNLVVGDEYQGVRQISFMPRDSRTETALKFNKDGIIQDSMIPELNGKNIEEVFGKDLGNKISNSSPYERFEGVDLDVGGEGMKGFYDTIIPSYIKKQYGVEMSEYPINVRNLGVVRDNSGEGFAVVKPGGLTVAKYPTLEEARVAAKQMSEIPYHSFDITPEMREQITTQGQPLYQLAPVGGAIGAGMMATDEEPAQYKRGGPVSMDAMRLAVMDKNLRKQHG